MTTVQIIGVSVAGAAVLLLIIALVISRRRGRDEEQDEVRTGPSFLDQAPQDTFSVLGKPEQDVEDITIDPALERALAAERAAAREQEPRQPPPGGLGLDWGPDLSVRELDPGPLAAPSWGDDPEVTGELRPAATPAAGDEGADDPEVTGELRADAESPAADEGPDEAEVTGELRPGEAVDDGPRDEEMQASTPVERPAPGQDEAPAVEEDTGGPQLVPLSDIIVTTSSKTVDLRDPDVRRMLTELVTFEIDQAADYRRRGQTIDAVLQLTEAEKVSRALGMKESAQRIRAMMEEIRGE